MNMGKLLRGVLLVVGAAALSGGVGAAHALAYVPADALCTTNDNSALDAGELEALLGTAPCGSLDVQLTLGYKDNVGGSEEGALAGSYETTFSNTASDPADATIEYVSGQPAFSCPECFLVVKDGNQTPAQYIFNLSGWDGTSSIVLTGFWPNQGAISHVAIFSGEGGDFDIPEPGTLALLGMAFAGIAALRGRRRI